MHLITETPAVVRVAEAMAVVQESLERLDRVRAEQSFHNRHGGDPGIYRNHMSLIRHGVNYAVGAAAVAAVEVPGPVVDVGSGTGGFSQVLARLTARSLHLVDVDAQHVRLAAAAFPELQVHTDLGSAPRAAAICAMEVIEHLRPRGQEAFVRSLARQVLPGGCLVLSTPDESGYPGGRSCYRPHIGPLDASALLRTVSAGTGEWPVHVLRIDGPGFRLGRVARIVQPVLNRVWGVASRGPGRVVEAAVARASHHRSKDRPPPEVPPDSAWTTTDAVGTDSRRAGTGLVAVAVRPLSRPRVSPVPERRPGWTRDPGLVPGRRGLVAARLLDHF